MGLFEKKARCYLRGATWLGLLNTITGCLFNRVLVRRSWHDDGKWTTQGFYWDKAANWPKQDEQERRQGEFERKPKPEKPRLPKPKK